MKYPGLKDVEYHYAKMEPGDCLYIPYLWYILYNIVLNSKGTF